MSAALLLPTLHAAASASTGWVAAAPGPHVHYRPAEKPAAEPGPSRAGSAPVTSLAFYRKHTEKMLRRYLYASMLVGRAPSILNEPITRGWVSSRPVRTFEDAVIFVLDVENCLARLRPLDRLILGKIVLQEYSYEEVALLFRVHTRAISTRLGNALDRLTQTMLDAGVLFIT